MGENDESADATIDELIELLSSPDQEDREMAAGKLGFFGSEAVRAIPDLKRALSDPVREVRYTAGIAVGAIVEAIAELVEPAKATLQIIGRIFEADSG